jgi:hypothetical protein
MSRELLFTHTLTNDITLQAQLCDTIGLLMTDFGHQQTKGGHRADIIATEVISENELSHPYSRGKRAERRIVIEAQLKKTDGKHATKLPAYLRAFDAQIGILIAEDFSPKWQDDIRKLNEKNTGEIYYLVLANLTGDVPNFNVICRPDDIAKFASLRASRDKVKKTLKQLREQITLAKYSPFLQGLIRHFEEYSIFRLTACRRHYAHVAVGTTNAYIEVLCPLKGLTTGFRIHNDPDLYQRLLDRRKMIENEVGEELVWDAKPDKKVTTISFATRRDWNLREAKKQYRIFVNQVERFHPVIVKYLEIVKAERKAESNEVRRRTA